MQRINVGTQQLGIAEFQRLLFAPNTTLEIDEYALRKVENNHEFLKHFAVNKVIYGVNTGFGPMAQYIIDSQDVQALQYNLIRSHSTGMGQPIPPLYVKAIMIARLNTLMLARSGVHAGTVALLREMINRDICPCIYEHGSVGASGDLVQLAHLALSMIGEGKVFHQGAVKPTREVFAAEGLQPIAMHLREGLALINGTSAMTGIGVINVLYTRRLLEWAVRASSIVNEIVEAYDDHFSASLNAAKLHEGQRQVAARMRAILHDSRLIRSRTEHLYQRTVETGRAEDKIQEYYSIRCIPQVLGPVADTLQHAEKIVIDELNSANDNPLVFEEEHNVFHGGNFHGDYVAMEMDKLKMAVTKLSMLCERQLNYLLNNKLNNKLPPFLNLGQIGFNFGMQGAQFTATSTVAENQTLSYPMYLHSIPNNNDNQDIVSMGTNAALLAKKVIDNAFEVMAIEWLAILQAIDYLHIADRLSSASKAVFFELRAIVPIFDQDFPLSDSLQQLCYFLKNEAIERE